MNNLAPRFQRKEKGGWRKELGGWIISLHVSSLHAPKKGKEKGGRRMEKGGWMNNLAPRFLAPRSKEWRKEEGTRMKDE
jgi:hypothetical protein